VITPLDGWSWEPTADGVLLRAPGAVIHYRERVRPSRPLVELVHAACAGLDVDRLVGPEPVVTDEGEHAAIVTVHAGPVTLTLGYVFGDDFHAEIHGAGDAADAVRRLVRTDRHMLGVRRRRCRYVAPAGWRALPHASIFHDTWESPDGAARITVCPAVPLADEPVGEGDREPVVTARLAGHAWTSPTRTLVVLRDRTYAYTVALDGRAAELDAVVASVEPVPPRAGATADPTASWASCWSA